MPPLLDERLLIGCKQIHGGEHLIRGLIHERGSCFIECAMNATGTLANGVLDQSKILQLIGTRTGSDPALMQVFVASCVQCFQIPAQYVASSNYPKDSKFCNPMAAHFISCVNMESFKMCLPNFWTNTDSCNTLRNYIASCPIPS
ncbi:general odorant-binding protein 67-like [Ochlerotatus camptorhynchus]|uniref:general odorant-binding protein 67-like n=1 Tax=Ochlerotatus camptorhynchus TaxID=644619 RepID=UPI0031E48837